MTVLRDQDDAFAYGETLLVGQRVRLRATTDDDLPVLTEPLTDPAIRITQSSTAAPHSHATARAVVAEWNANKGDGAGFSIETLDGEPDPRTVIGSIGLFGISAKDRHGTVGIALDRAHVGRGYGTDAMRIMVAFGFRELSLHSIQLNVLEFNARAIAAYRKVGFVEEGRRRQMVHHDGHWYDQVLMSILEDEWRAKQQAATG